MNDAHLVLNFFVCVYFFQMNFLLISTLVIASITIFPAITYGSTTTEIEELPHALPIVTADAAHNTPGEIWQEDEREVLIRSERGAKNAGATGGVAGGAAATVPGSGKREKNKRININKNKNSGEKIESAKEKIERTERPLKVERPTKIEKSTKSEKREKSQKKSRKFYFSFFFHFCFSCVFFSFYIYLVFTTNMLMVCESNTSG